MWISAVQGVVSQGVLAGGDLRPSCRSDTADAVCLGGVVACPQDGVPACRCCPAGCLQLGFVLAGLNGVVDVDRRRECGRDVPVAQRREHGVYGGGETIRSLRCRVECACVD